MIRRLTEGDREPTLAFVAAESAFNLVILADIHNYGCATDCQQVWGRGPGAVPAAGRGAGRLAPVGREGAGWESPSSSSFPIP